VNENQSTSVAKYLRAYDRRLFASNNPAIDSWLKGKKYQKSLSLYGRDETEVLTMLLNTAPTKLIIRQ
jgi:hypothetical protein